MIRLVCYKAFTALEKREALAVANFHLPFRANRAPYLRARAWLDRMIVLPILR